MIVVDTSVWIGHLRNQQSAPVNKLRALENFGDILLGDLVLLEILQGARDERHSARMSTALRQFPIATMLGADLAVTLRAITEPCGVSASPFARRPIL